MAMIPADLAAAITAATESLEKPSKDSTDADIAAYTTAAQEAFAGALITYMKDNAEVIGDVIAGIQVENSSSIVTGTTRTGFSRLDGTIQ